nr:radical SAM protein [Deltaproteobacteria bacterium]
MQTSSTPVGYTAAHVVRDYTHRIELSDGESLIFNLLTGLGWRGPSNDDQGAVTAVEARRGDEPASAVLEQMESDFSKSSRPVAFQLIPTYGCNFKCSYCYEGSLTSEQRQWDETDVANVVAACQRLVKESGCPFSEAKFTVLGGEVIRASTFAGVEALVKGLRDAGGQRFEAVTNGYELADHAERMQKLGITVVQVTVDGPQKIHDKRRPIRVFRGSSFERILEGVGRCLDLGIQ